MKLILIVISLFTLVLILGSCDGSSKPSEFPENDLP